MEDIIEIVNEALSRAWYQWQAGYVSAYSYKLFVQENSEESLG